MRRTGISQPLPVQNSSFNGYLERIRARLQNWQATRLTSRIWEHDPGVWVANPAVAAKTPELADRLGWLTLPTDMQAHVPTWRECAQQVCAEGFTDVVLLGMGGSSLAPELYAATFGSTSGYPRLHIMDSTHPEAVRQTTTGLDIPRTLFIVSSKSGGTIETMSLYRHFHHLAAQANDTPGQQFIAITDPGSSLEKLAQEAGFRAVFPGIPEVGGRYSALSAFGLVPAMLIGAPVEELLACGAAMAAACSPRSATSDNPALILGAAMGELALSGRDKLTLLTSPKIASFGPWVEQLVAESTGKNGAGILPVVESNPGPASAYGSDRFFACLRLAGDENDLLDQAVRDYREAGYPLVEIQLAKSTDLGAEFFRWELATAAAGAILGINPFNQPDVEAAKSNARNLMEEFSKSGNLPAPAPDIEHKSATLYITSGPIAKTLKGTLESFVSQAESGSYIALQAYLPQNAALDAMLHELAAGLRDHTGCAVTVGYGPRFLHSTGQLHKGDGNNGLFIQISSDTPEDLPVPEEKYTFGVLINAQMQGDYQALCEARRRVMRLKLNAGPQKAPKMLRTIFKTFLHSETT